MSPDIGRIVINNAIQKQCSARRRYDEAANRSYRAEYKTGRKGDGFQKKFSFATAAILIGLVQTCLDIFDFNAQFMQTYKYFI